MGSSKPRIRIHSGSRCIGAASPTAPGIRRTPMSGPCGARGRRPSLTSEEPMWKREHYEALTGVDDLVNYAFLIHQRPGIALLKDGAFLRAWYFQGPDLDYAVPEELERLSHVTAQAFPRCGNGWMLHVQCIRRAQRGYLDRTIFPDPTSALIDEERRRTYERDGHFRSIAALALTYRSE